MAYRGSYSFGWGLTPWVQRLLIANGVVFVVMMIVPALMWQFAFVPRLALLRPWTLLTYMFTHAGFLHLFFNMIGLFFFGPPLEERWGSVQFAKFYFFCGLGGAAFSFLFAFHNPVVGASAAVFGIMLAFAMNWPNAPIYIWGILPIPAKYLVGILVIMSLMSAFGGGGGNIAHFAHIGGFVFALIYLKFFMSRFGPGPLESMRQRFRQRNVRAVRDDDLPATRAPAPQPPPRPDRRVLDELDRVLDKISNEGMSSLTPQERKLLDEVSRKYRTD